MTHIETDNPLIKLEIWWQDLIVQYWYITVPVVLVLMYIIWREDRKQWRK